MKKFQFKLEALLKYREYLAHKLKLEVASAVADVEACKLSIERTKQEQIKTVQHLSTISETGIDGNTLLRYTEYVSTLEIEIDIRNTELITLKEILIEKRNRLKKKSIDKKVIENLKDLKKDEYHHELNLMIQKESDDMVSIRRTGEQVKS